MFYYKVYRKGEPYMYTIETVNLKTEKITTLRRIQAVCKLREHATMCGGRGVVHIWKGSGSYRLLLQWHP